jgi:hypothetical protein
MRALGVLVLTACASPQRELRQVYPLGDGDDVLPAARRAATKLGWRATPQPDGDLVIDGLPPSATDGTLRIHAGARELEISAPTSETDPKADPMGALPDLLAAATQQERTLGAPSDDCIEWVRRQIHTHPATREEIDEACRHPPRTPRRLFDAPTPPRPRSTALLTVLDVLSPAVGAFYLLGDRSPFHANDWDAAWLMPRVLGDVGVDLLLVISSVALALTGLTPTTLTPWGICGGLAMLSRVLALHIDLPIARFVNAWSASGYAGIAPSAPSEAHWTRGPPGAGSEP